MVEIISNKNLKINLEIINFSLLGKVLIINYKELFLLNDKKITSNHVLITECTLNYIDNNVVEEILKQHYI